MKKTILFFAVFVFFIGKNNSQTITDYDGNVYNTVTIGTQIWMKENLKVTHYCNGDPIPNVTNDTAWGKLTTGAYCVYINDTSYGSTYGNLYNWYTMTDDRNIAPTGWHVPTDYEWKILTTYLGSESIAGGKLKESSFTHWLSPNTCATNSTGFTALPGGFRYCYGEFDFIGGSGFWWSSTKIFQFNAYYQSMSYDSCNIERDNFYYIGSGLSVRCIKDTLGTQINENRIDKNIQIYPNPASDKLYINCANRQYLNMQVYNSVGQCILKRELNTQTNTIDISPLTRGIYIMKLTNLNGTFEKKIIKE